MLEALTDASELVPKDYLEMEQQYFSLLQSKKLGKAMSNLSEYLIEDIIKQKAG